MSKTKYTIFSIIIGLIILLFLAWWNIPNLVGFYIGRQLHTKVTVSDITFTKDSITIDNLKVFNPKNSKSKTALEIKKILINAQLKDLFNKKATLINLIQIDDIKLGVEFYNTDGTENNWKNLMANNNGHNKNPHPYTIKKLSLNNLSVTLTKNNGQTKEFPIVENLELYNITDESGFPINQLEKAIIHSMLKSIFQRFGLSNILNTITSPIKIIPNILNLP
jgi:hypothetical protein